MVYMYTVSTRQPRRVGLPGHPPGLLYGMDALIASHVQYVGDITGGILITSHVQQVSLLDVLLIRLHSH